MSVPGLARRGRARTRRLALIAALIVIDAPAAAAAADPVARWRAPIAEASVRFGVPPAWIERVIRAESGGRTTLGGRPITSRAGAMGLMQLMPATWAAMRAAHGLGADPQDPRDNILAGTAYLRAMLDRFGYPGLFGAYNAGPARYAAYLAGRALPAETRVYMATIGRPPGPVPPVSTTPRVARLFVSRLGQPVPELPRDAAGPDARSSALFVVLTRN